MERLSFAKGNAKLRQPGLYTFSLPAGWSCPGALECLAKADRNTGRILDAAESAFADFSHFGVTSTARPRFSSSSVISRRRRALSFSSDTVAVPLRPSMA